MNTTFFNKLFGLTSGVTEVLLLQQFTGDFDLPTKVILWSLAGVLGSVIGTRCIAAINKLADLPSKAEWVALTLTLNSLSTNLGTHIAGYEQWKKDMERRMSDEEDKE